jgi:hypothetical protein
MKLNITKTTKLLLLIFSMSFFFACSSDDDGGSATGTNSSISYKVNGETFNCNIVGYAVDEFNYISISGGFSNDSDNSTSLLVFGDQVGSDAFAGSTTILYNGVEYFAYVGNVIINNTDKVQGTFSGTFNINNTGNQTITVTEGRFEIFKD